MQPSTLVCCLRRPVRKQRKSRQRLNLLIPGVPELGPRIHPRLQRSCCWRSSSGGGSSGSNRTSKSSRHKTMIRSRLFQIRMPKHLKSHRWLALGTWWLGLGPGLGLQARLKRLVSGYSLRLRARGWVRLQSTLRLSLNCKPTLQLRHCRQSVAAASSHSKKRKHSAIMVATTSSIGDSREQCTPRSLTRHWLGLYLLLEEEQEEKVMMVAMMKDGSYCSATMDVVARRQISSGATPSKGAHVGHARRLWLTLFICVRRTSSRGFHGGVSFLFLLRIKAFHVSVSHHCHHLRCLDCSLWIRARNFSGYPCDMSVDCRKKWSKIVLTKLIWNVVIDAAENELSVFRYNKELESRPWPPKKMRRNRMERKPVVSRD